MSGVDDANAVESSAVDETTEPRRRFLGWLSGAGMVAGLVAAYGTLGAFIGRFLFPARPAERGWMFVTNLDRMNEGDSLVYKTPGGAPVNITRRSRETGDGAFVALSSTCLLYTSDAADD